MVIFLIKMVSMLTSIHKLSTATSEPVIHGKNTTSINIDSFHRHRHQDDDILCHLEYAMIITAGFIMLHSAFLHRWKYNLVRIHTEIAASSALVCGILLLVAYQHLKIENWSLFFEICYSIIFTLGLQLPDNYLFFYRLVSVATIHRGYRVLIHIFIWLALLCAWLPAQTIIPQFYDKNSEPHAHEVGHIIQLVSLSTILVYKFYFTGYFIWRLYNILPEEKKALAIHGPMKLVFVKSIGHWLTSSAGLLLLLPSYRSAVHEVLCCMVITLGMHFFVNCPTASICLLCSNVSPRHQWEGLSDLSSIEGFTNKKERKLCPTMASCLCVCFGGRVDNEIPQPVSTVRQPVTAITKGKVVPEDMLGIVPADAPASGPGSEPLMSLPVPAPGAETGPDVQLKTSDQYGRVDGKEESGSGERKKSEESERKPGIAEDRDNDDILQYHVNANVVGSSEPLSMIDDTILNMNVSNLQLLEVTPFESKQQTPGGSFSMALRADDEKVPDSESSVR